MISFTNFLIQAFIVLSPAFIVVCFFMIIMSWLRILVDILSGRGW